MNAAFKLCGMYGKYKGVSVYGTRLFILWNVDNLITGQVRGLVNHIRSDIIIYKKKINRQETWAGLNTYSLGQHTVKHKRYGQV